MAKDPLSTRFTEMLGIEFPIIAFTHCKDVAVAVINSGGFAVLGEAMHTPDDIAADIQWIRDRVDGNQETFPLPEATKKLLEEVQKRAVRGVHASESIDLTGDHKKQNEY